MCNRNYGVCPLCKAAPGHPCLTWRGTAREPHADRPVSPDTPRPTEWPVKCGSPTCPCAGSPTVAEAREDVDAAARTMRYFFDDRASGARRDRIWKDYADSRDALISAVRQEEAAKHRELIEALRSAEDALSDLLKPQQGAHRTAARMRAHSRLVGIRAALLPEVPR